MAIFANVIFFAAWVGLGLIYYIWKSFMESTGGYTDLKARVDDFNKNNEWAHLTVPGEFD